MKVLGSVLRVLFCWPLFLGSGIALAINVLWGDRKANPARWVWPVLVVTLAPDSWPMRTWYKPKPGWSWGGTTFGWGVMLTPTRTPEILAHEMVHVEQDEAGVIGGLILGLLVLALTRSWEGLGALFFCWGTTHWWVYLGASLAALVRGESSAYRGNVMEEAAYDATRSQVVPLDPKE